MTMPARDEVPCTRDGCCDRERTTELVAFADASTPLAKWDDDDWWDDRVLWWSRLDEQYLVESRRAAGGHALLLAFDHRRGDALVLEQVVPLIGDPRYGPDPDDVERWQKLVVECVDQMRADPRDRAWGKSARINPSARRCGAAPRA